MCVGAANDTRLMVETKTVKALLENRLGGGGGGGWPLLVPFNQANFPVSHDPSTNCSFYLSSKPQSSIKHSIVILVSSLYVLLNINSVSSWITWIKLYWICWSIFSWSSWWVGPFWHRGKLEDVTMRLPICHSPSSANKQLAVLQQITWKRLNLTRWVRQCVVNPKAASGSKLNQLKWEFGI